MNLRPVSAAVLLLLSTLTTSVGAEEARRAYIVQLVDKPVASYTGDVNGLPATKPAEGTRLDVDATAVQNYISYLETKQADVMSTVSSAQITHTYNVVLNGFAAMLTDSEVRALKKNSGVANITADTIMQLDTNYTPTFLGINQPDGLWSKLGGVGAAGENMVIGIIDSGIWPENPSFADKVDADGVPTHGEGTQVYGPPPATWKGTCKTGEGFSVANCNNKLIGANYFKAPTQTLHWTEFLSARDSVAGATGKGGHGTHTASTAGGNANTKVTSGVVATVSGVAPRARIAAYKVCWTDGVSGGNGCAGSNSVAAIEQAIKDGVNVLNFSIGPNAGGGTFNDPTEVAFLNAANAGVFVATSAGNGGPTGANFVPTAHLSPWLTSVGNSTHNRIFQGTATLGNGTKLIGVSTNGNNAQTPLILAGEAGFDGVPVTQQQQQCFGSADGVAAKLDPAKVAGKILVCDRGNNVLVNKSANAKTAGASGMILANIAGFANTTLVAPHSLSTIHIDIASGTTLKSYMAANPGSATAAIGDVVALVGSPSSAPIMNSSSSRGPNVANANILKPDLTAPGTDILAGVTADLTMAQRDAVAAGGVAPRVDWEFYTGTSMASPHVAGMAALLKQMNPTWTPMMIKSALMTTAQSTKPDPENRAIPWDSSATTTGTLPWGQGAGHATPNLAAKPGLVYDAGILDFARFTCGVQANVYSAATCAAIGTIQPYNLNLASLTAANVLGTLTMTRTVTNVNPTTTTFNASATLPGFTVAVTPSTLTLAPNAKATFSVKLTRTSAPLNAWAYGSLVWNDGAGTTVRSPLTARPSALAVPSVVFSEAKTGSKTITIGTGFTGPMTSVRSGLLPAVQETRTVGESGTNSTVYLAACRAGGGAGVNVHNVTMAAGNLHARFALFDDDTQGGSASDLDLIVVRPDNSIVSSGNSGSNEVVNLPNPAAGNYKVCVIGYEPKDGSAEYKLSSWVLAPNVINGNFKALMPAFAYIGGTGSVLMSWSDLGSARHLGAVRYLVGGVVQGTTIVDVDTTDPVPLAMPARATPVLAD